MATRRSYFIPNLIVGTRVALAFVAAALLQAASPWTVGWAVVLTVVAIAMDGLDGYVARRMNLTSELGSILDITADRIVEHVYWIAFAVYGAVGLWVPLVVVTRSFLVDTVRGVALAQGRTAFGERTLATSRVSRFLTGSRVMRNLYGGAKVAAFVLLGSAIAVGRTWATGTPMLGSAGVALLGTAAQGAVWMAVVLCVVRGVPVLLDGRAYLTASEPASGRGA